MSRFGFTFGKTTMNSDLKKLGDALKKRNIKVKFYGAEPHVLPYGALKVKGDQTGGWYAPKNNGSFERFIPDLPLVPPVLFKNLKETVEFITTKSPDEMVKAHDQSKST